MFKSLFPVLKSLIVGLSFSFLTACASTVPVYDDRYSVVQIADLMAQDFDTESVLLKRALKPTFEKYGSPQAYISGNMSGVYGAKTSRLYGSGISQFKTALPSDVFWQVDGQNLETLLSPIETVHLVYRKALIRDKEAKLLKIGELNKRGHIFTVFERLSGNEIVVTVNLSQDLPLSSTLDVLEFPHSLNYFDARQKL